ncbi:hypothetical protein ISU02_02670 [Fusibacter sp. Q10-2]|uniref:Uncharacterized protein n=1 Tax=Fusibacter ferrireducens TaxID=2785058 RepID=A0ABR9ZNV8_9FIRM|nr:hypothetical protein [Fusibacter ferrireducens]
MHKFSRFLVLLVIGIGLNASVAFANSMEPPSLLILVNNPTDDISIVMVSNEHQPKAQFKRTAWEGYFIFYSQDMQTDGHYTFRVTTQDKTFECTFDKRLRRYNEVLTLDISKETLTYGRYPFRSALIVSLRVILTLLIEAIVFWFYKFREKRSWIVFLVINLLTQGVLNIWLIKWSTLLGGYLILYQVHGEFFVFLAEIVGFSLFIREKGKWPVIKYVIVANLVSLIAGGFLITLLPV